MNPSPEILELDAQGRESLVLDVALPVVAAWRKHVRVFGFRPSMGVSGLNPREVARLRTLALASGARATGVFEGANDFRFAFPEDSDQGLGIEADLSGHAVAPAVSDLSIASFGMAPGTAATHRLKGFTHQRLTTPLGYAGRVLARLGRELGLDLTVKTEEPGFEPQGEGKVAIEASRRSEAPDSLVSWKDRGPLVGVVATLGGVRPRPEQLARIETALKSGFWESRRLEPAIERLVTSEGDAGAFVQLDVQFERGGAAFIEIVPRQATPEVVARRLVSRALAFCDGYAAGDEFSGLAVLAAAAAARASFELALVPSPSVDGAATLLGELGARVELGEAPGLTVVSIGPPEAAAPGPASEPV